MGKIKQIFPGMLVISVQNGTRWDLSSPTQPHLDFDQYFSFGAVEKDIFSQGGHFAMQVSPIGSIRAGIFKEKFSVPHEKKFDICFISQFTQPYTNVPDQWWHELISTYSETEKQLFSIVTDFVEKNNLKFCIAMRCSLDTPEFKDECRYFPLSEKTQIVRIPQNKFSSYKAVQASRLSVTISSTLGYEAMGLGERVIFAKDIKSVASVVMGGWTKNLVTHRLPELQRLYSLNYDEFNSKAIELLNMKDTEYLDYSKEARAYYMNIDLEHLPQEIIKNKIERFLS